MEHKCNHFKELMDEQKAVILRDIKKYEWYNHVEDINSAVKDFITKYGWIMREIFCDRCTDNSDCKDYQKYLSEDSEVDKKGLVEVIGKS